MGVNDLFEAWQRQEKNPPPLGNYMKTYKIYLKMSLNTREPPCKRDYSLIDWGKKTPKQHNNKPNGQVISTSIEVTKN